MMEFIDEPFDDWNLRFLEDDFIAELDSWLSADIICCDNCYDDFISNWPIVRRSKSFCSMEVSTFYDGSRLRDMYPKDIFLENVHLVQCPRCGEGLTHNFWAYNFDFDDYESLETDFESLREDIKETPLIVLKNNLADRTFSIIQELRSKQDKTMINFPLYRGRIIPSGIARKEDFLAPPKAYTKEGRYNHLGIPVIYAANKEITCYNELRKPTENLFIAEITIDSDLLLLNLNKIENSESDENLLQAIVLSSIASSKANDNDTYKPEYYFTRFISDCCKYLGFDGIIYPSVHVGVGENFVLFNTNLVSEKNIVGFRLYESKTTMSRHLI